MPKFKKNTSPAMKRSTFKMAGYGYPGTPPPTRKKRSPGRFDKKKVLEAILIAEGARAGASGEESKTIKTFNQMRESFAKKKVKDVTEGVQEKANIDDIELASGKVIKSRGGKIVLGS